MKKILIVVAAFFTGAAASQYVYYKRVTIGITGAEAAQAANWFLANGAWDGTVAEMENCCVARTGNTDDYPTGFIASCYGTATVSADSLPAGAVVKEVIP